MNPYSRYIEDENFLKWVFHPSEESNTYWAAYLKRNPKEKKVVQFLKDFLLALETKDIRLSLADKQRILEQIERRLTEKDKSFRFRNTVKKSLKYAASLAIILILGFYFLNSPEKGQHVFEGLQEASLDTISETQLILGSGEQVVLENEKSTVVYSNSGTVIINQKDTLNRSVQKELKKEHFNQLIVPYGKRSKITLSDGSVVHLNSGTKLLFPEQFIGSERKIYLDGEAYFEVATNKERPFVVKSMNSGVDVKALGTRFNVSAYSSDTHVMAVLVEGKVHVVKSGQQSSGKEEIIMSPSELATWSKDGVAIEVIRVNIYPYISWMDGVLQCESESLHGIVKKVERYYDIKIDFDDALGKQIRITGKLDLNEKIEKTLENIVTTANIDYIKISDKKFMIKK